ncbi:hypothetical protein [Chitinophaga ginsengisoli]|uniref:Uncharacterized protein n=1 Tax=Chitinophaga ginsengisoli TaxID=363837 RepID=A0A2P8GLV4_9BACT|nr:hypothetical protein [Chitinophaga ginsengisoli]PSL34944.1 hypothetical protein CLV42_102518 [Chitinophaga ginsengisoli]
MKKTLLLLLCLWALHSFGQDHATFNPETWKAPYYLPVEGWGIERFPIPIEFAPTIPYKGVEDIRFTKGWGEANSEEYWSYSFLWYLDGAQKISADVINKNLNAYYDGLIGRNIEKRNIPAAMVTKTKTQVTKLGKPQGSDEATYSGTVSMLDYMAKKPMVLNCVVHVIKCPGMANTIVLHQLSPQPLTSAVWTKMKELRGQFDCNKR